MNIDRKYVKDTIVDLLPLLELHQKTEKWAYIGFALGYITDFDWQSKKIPNNLLEIGFFGVYIGGYVGAFVLFPRITSVVNFVFETRALLKKSSSQTDKACIFVAEAIYMAGSWCDAPVLKAMSLFCRTVSQFSQATYGFEKKPDSVRTGVKIIMGCAKAWECGKKWLVVEKQIEDKMHK